MIVDTSAVAAILFAETDADRFADAIAAADPCRISAANYVEAAVVVDLRGDATASRQFDTFFRRAGIVVEPVTEEQARLARQAYLDYGKGRHRAGLDLGDCFAYALAKATGEPLLYKGRDFARTDVEPAL
jgi:ribonuclease VapC